MDNKITDPEILKRLQEESNFIESLMEIGNLGGQEIDEEIVEETSSPLEETVDLVKNRHGEYITFDDSLVYIEHRDYYVDEDESVWLNFEGRSEDTENIIDVLGHDNETIEVSNDYEDLVCVESDIIYLSESCAKNNGYKLTNDGTWIKEEIIIDNDINKSELLFYSDMEHSLNQFYPNNWWFQKNNYTFDYTNEIRKNQASYFYSYEYVLIIKFPFIEITNSKKEIHIIEDLYVIVPFNKHGNCKANIYGFRGKLTNLEYSNNYYHSHLSNTHELHVPAFCLGTGPLNQILSTMYSKPFNKDFFSYFLANLNVYVSWESIEGSPYRRMENNIIRNKIIPKENEDQPPFKEFIEKSLDNLDFDIEYDNTSKLFDINFKKLELELTNLYLKNSQGYSFTLVFKDEELNEYFTLRNSNSKNPNLSIPLCKLDDKNIYLEYVSVENKNTSFIKTLHPTYIYYAKKYLIGRINEHYLKKNKNRLLGETSGEYTF